MTMQVAPMKLKYYRAGYLPPACFGPAKACISITPAQNRSGRGYGPSDVLRYSDVNISFDFERDLYRRSTKPTECAMTSSAMRPGTRPTLVASRATVPWKRFGLADGLGDPVDAPGATLPVAVVCPRAEGPRASLAYLPSGLRTPIQASRTC